MEEIKFPSLDDQWMLATDVATALGISRQMVNRRIQQGYFGSVHTLGNRLYLIRTEEVKTKLSTGILTAQFDQQMQDAHESGLPGY